MTPEETPSPEATPVSPPDERPTPAKWPGNDRVEIVVGVVVTALVALTWIALCLQ
jgi:hypothetical protein